LLQQLQLQVRELFTARHELLNFPVVHGCTSSWVGPTLTAELQPSAVIWKSAISASTNASAKTRVATGIAQSASLWPAPSGLRSVKRNLSTPNISTSSSPCRKRLPPSPTRTSKWSTTFSSGPLPKPYAPLPPIPNIWALRSVFSPCCIVGDRTCF